MHITVGKKKTNSRSRTCIEFKISEILSIFSVLTLASKGDNSTLQLVQVENNN